ncbi:MAG TPA: sterol desaturase family protein [Pseudobdellovibrionaceae bacterium]|nr:sterol desaturase family protein [Pseudobdellovibrionaceae bacterium]
MGNVVAYAIPFFFVILAAEALWAHRRGLKVMTARATLANALTGLLERLILVFNFAFLFWAYSELSSWVPWVWSTDSIWVWPAAFVISDFLYYFLHRAHHRVGFLWAAHVVHHQSEEMNFSVGLRTAPLQALVFSAPFYLPAILLGVPALPFFVANGLMNSLQLLVHTRAASGDSRVWRILGVAFNTPSHHRVHHGQESQYLDRNFGAFFIVWDKLFGSFVPESAEPTYGARHRLLTANPLRAVADEYRRMWRIARVFASRVGWDEPLRALRVWLSVWLMSPENLQAQLDQNPIEAIVLRDRQDAQRSWPQPDWRLTFMALMPLVLAFFFLYYLNPRPEGVLLVGMAGYILLGLQSVGEALDASRKFWFWEWARGAWLMGLALLILNKTSGNSDSSLVVWAAWASLWHVGLALISMFAKWSGRGLHVQSVSTE